MAEDGDIEIGTALVGDVETERDVGSGGGGEAERAGPLTDRSCETERWLLSLAAEGLRFRVGGASNELES